MKFTLGWLHDHLDTEASLAEIVEKLTALGLEVEAVDDGGALDGFLVGEIITCDPHPDADALSVCEVDDGTGRVQIVCGAPNARAGLKGVLAPVGVQMPAADFTIARRKIRGVESAGMLCSARELGYGDDDTGIIDLGDEARAGQAAAEALGLDDPTIEIAITPNRPDCLGVRGIARDLAAAGLGVLKPAPTAAIEGTEKSPIKVAVEGTGCAYFAGCFIRDVKWVESPDWIKRRLKAIGVRPIGALVDITNYIAYDRARPLHVYDADTLTGALTARPARKGESFEALDGNSYELTEADCVIADDAAVQGLAGVIGGAASAAAETTRNVFVESAWFEPTAIAQSGRHHNIDSDARHRFERGVDRHDADLGLAAAVQMIVELCGGTPSAPVSAGEAEVALRAVAYDAAAVEKLTGLAVAPDTQREILTALGFAWDGADAVQVPSWRPDIAGAPDLVEEVVRIHGLDDVPETPMDITPTSPADNDRAQALAARRALAARGLVEAVTWSFISEAAANRFGVASGLELANPIAAGLSHMRPSLLPGLLEAAARNLKRAQIDPALFEAGHIFTGATPGAQRFALAGVRVGARAPRHWQTVPAPVDAWLARADAEAALAAYGATEHEVRRAAPDTYHPGCSGVLTGADGETLAAFGAVHPDVAAQFDLADAEIVAFEVFPDMCAADTEAHSFAPSNLQPVRRDFAFEVAADIAAEAVLTAARASELVADVLLFDVFSGTPLPDGVKSLAIQVILQPHEATLTDADIEAASAEIVKSVEKATGATLRK